MSNMASEMAARMREDGRDPETETITPLAPLEDGGAAGPGTGGPAPTQQTPPAGAQNTDTSTDGQDPGPVPYSRFREVNERAQRLASYEPLAEYGYDADSLTRLANFEANYVRDPGNAVYALVDNLDLPAEAKTSIREALGLDDSEPPAGGGNQPTPTSTDAEPPAWFKPYADREQQRAQQEQAEAEARAEQQQTQARQEALDQVLSHWDEMDKGAGIASPRESIKLALIASTAASGAYQDPQSLAKAARAEWIAERENAVGSHLVLPGSVTGPRSVPGSAATASPPSDFGGDIKKATKAAEAAMLRGDLPLPGA